MASAKKAMGEAWELASQNHIDKEQIANYFGETLFSLLFKKTWMEKLERKVISGLGCRSKLGMKDRLARKVA